MVRDCDLSADVWAVKKRTLVERTTMSFSRGDRKPCTYSGCDGTMQFSRYARRGQLEVGIVGDSRSNLPAIGETAGWICDTDARHFETTSVDAAWRV
jgi:hypothetical protein